jgi:hypothetical protein
MAKAKKDGSMVQGFMVLVVLLLCSGAAGFAVGYTQKFHPEEKVAPGAGGIAATSATTGTDVSGSSNTTPATLKKVYWIKTKGWERAGYAIKVIINGNDAGTYQTPDRLQEVTKFIKPGENKIQFIAKSLPAGNRSDYDGSYLELNLYQGSKYSSNGYKDGEKLVSYSRKITETDDFDDSQDFTVVE